eukprot:gene29035-32236_t
MAPLRDEGILIMGSGLSVHNMKAFFADPGSDSGAKLVAAMKEFDVWLNAVCTSRKGPDRNAQLTLWDKAPSGKQAHPREEHLIPLLVVAGAAADSHGVSLPSSVGSLPMSSFLFGG